MSKTILVWFRNDLRIHDNEILLEAVKKSDRILPVYCFDPRQFTETQFGTLKTGVRRAKFLIESVSDLKHSLQSLGGDLLVLTGKPEEILPSLVERYNITEVYHHREVATEETRVSSLVEDALWKLRVNLKHFIGHTMYHKEDLPFPIKDIPDIFTTFRKKIERDSHIRPSFETPVSISVPVDLQPSNVPSLSDLSYDDVTDEPLAFMQFNGGETEGLKRLHYYLWEKDLLKSYKATRDGLLGSDYSSHLSPWLAVGCLSTREVYWEVKKYERERLANDSTYWLVFELLWRDFFRFMFKKHGNMFFKETGFKDLAPAVSENQLDLFEKWKTGTTGFPFIDANMRELNATGFMSNRGRQNVASFLVKDLHVSWRLGAAYFEEKLIDYSPASNWGNWAYIAGVGNDPRDKRYFDVLKQALEYDPKGEYVRYWIPELADIPGAAIHQPWQLTPQQIDDFGVQLYPSLQTGSIKVA
ncbi:DASH family cryptochrome [Pedobacter sp. HMF7647]|uniref:Cryptochrome DASH n=1 Tax=Hufsiella arboris TaxID=2695275 RepID=A0A7K1YED1_9SPHI|nr:DASH family cryptochrome [Hufsiella arboris]MXV52956.1 DASH family cryptochrome [Hufsiella arboris]